MSENHKIREQIIENFLKFTVREKRVAEYVVGNYEQVKAMSNIELAEAVNVSNTTVVRFAKGLGYKGYLEFKNALKSENLAIRSPYTVLQHNKEISNDSILPKYFASIKRDTEEFINGLDYEAVDKITDKLLDAEIVYLVGIASDSTVVTYLNNYLPFIGIKCVLITEQGLALREKIMLLNERDMVLMSAFPTIQDEEKMVASYCQSVGATLAVITNSEISAQILNSEYYLISNESMVTFYNSYVLTMMICNILLMELNEKAPERAEEALNKFNKITQ